MLGAQVRHVDGRCGHRVSIQVESAKERRVLDGTDILIATGRTSNTDGLGLETTGVQLDERGYIRVNDRLLTTCENIWAIALAVRISLTCQSTTF